METDALILVGLDVDDKIYYRYQAFTERTRYLRRDNFHLTNLPVIGMTVIQQGAFQYPLHSMKVVTSYIRHNTILLRPLNLIYNGKELVFASQMDDTLRQIAYLKQGRAKVPSQAVTYSAEGYLDRSNDSITATRK
jgi:hypothetical protein